MKKLFLAFALLSNLFANAASDLKQTANLGTDWFYSLSTSTPLFESDRVLTAGKYRITGGTGWTPGLYTINGGIVFWNTGGDGVRNTLSLTTFTAGASGGIGYHAAGGNLFNRGVGGAQVDAMNTAATTDVDPLYSTTAHDYALVCQGDSLTLGAINGGVVSSAAHPDSYPAQMFATFTGSTEITHSHYVAWGGTNDIADSVSAATIETRITTLCSGRKAVGFKTYVMTILPRSDGAAAGDQETKRGTINTWLRGQFNVATANARVFKPATGVTWADAMVDVAANSNIGDAGDENDSTYYFADKLHMKRAGYGEVAADVYAAILIIDVDVGANRNGDFFFGANQRQTPDIWNRNYFPKRNPCQFKYQAAA